MLFPSDLSLEPVATTVLGVVPENLLLTLPLPALVGGDSVSLSSLSSSPLTRPLSLALSPVT